VIFDLFVTKREQTRDRVHSLTDELETARQWAHHSIERKAWFEFFFAGGYYHQLARQLDQTVHRAQRWNGQALTTLDDIIANWHQPEKSHARADQWREIGHRARTVGRDVAASKGRVGSHWTGLAADKYKGILDPQSRAANAVGHLAHHASAACDDMGRAVTAYNAGVLAAYNKYVTGMRFAMYMLGDNPQFGMWELMQTISRLSHDVGELKRHLKELQQKRAREFSQLMSSHTGFAADGKWPNAVNRPPAPPPSQPAQPSHPTQPTQPTPSPADQPSLGVHYLTEAEINDDQVPGLGPADIVRLRGRLIQLLLGPQIPYVVAEQIPSLLPSQVQYLQPPQVPYATAEQVHHFAPQQIQYATAEQVHHFLPPQVPYATAEQVHHFLPQQIQYATVEQLQYLRPHQIEHLTGAQIPLYRQFRA
jgi:uncharacterized protein YukE